MPNYSPGEQLAKTVLDSEMQDILVEGYRSTRVFAKVFFPDRFHSEFSPLHDQIFELIDFGGQKVAIAAPRGIGKTSIVGLALAAKKIVYEDSKFLPYVSKSFDSSLLQTENLKIELGSNRLIQQIFGRVNTQTGGTVDDSFSKKSWVARFNEESHGTLVYPRGANQQIRGILYKNARPDFFIFDDFEDADEVMSEELRIKLKTKFFADHLKAVSRVDKTWRIIYIDTLKHEDALLQNLLDASDWDSIRLELCNDELESNAPQFVSTEEIKREHAAHKEQGMLDVFYREFRNLPIATEDAVFRSEFFRYFVESPEGIIIPAKDGEKPVKIPERELTNVVIVDPAKTVKLASADSAVVVCGIHRQSRKILVRNVVAGKMEPDKLLEAAFAEVQRFRAMVLGVETTGIERWISQPIENIMRSRMTSGMTIPIYYAISASASTKPKRVAALSPYYKMGFIYHAANVCQKLESQLLLFPRSKLWDVMDALSHLIPLMDQFAYYFDPQDFGEESDDSEFKELLENDLLDKTQKFAFV